MEMIVVTVFIIVGILLGYFLRDIQAKNTAEDKWVLVKYDSFYDTSYEGRIPSCTFTIVNERTKEVFNRFSYAKMYSQGEIAEAIKLGVAHKLGVKDE